MDTGLRVSYGYKYYGIIWIQVLGYHMDTSLRVLHGYKYYGIIWIQALGYHMDTLKWVLKYREATGRNEKNIWVLKMRKILFKALHDLKKFMNFQINSEAAKNFIQKSKK